MKPTIGGKPTAHILDYIWKSEHPKQMQFPFCHPRSFFYFSSRYALADGIKVLGLQPGATVLLPAYNCGIEIEPFHYFGLRTEFYRVNLDLKIDLKDLSNRLNGNVSALLVTHYFGFPQCIKEIKTLCKKHGVFLIEDCAHALLSSCNHKDLGTFGDIAVFSVLKTLPVLNGGILVVNASGMTLQRAPYRPSRFSAVCHMSDLLLQKTRSSEDFKALIEYICYRSFSLGITAAKFIIAAFKKIFSVGGLHLVRPDSYDFKEELIAWSISCSSENIIAGTDMNHVKESRRNNFTRYLERFRVEQPTLFRLLYYELPEGICPLFFPLIIEKAGAREIVYRELKQRGITTYPWWDRFHGKVPWDEFPEAVLLKHNLHGLPVHQDLTPMHIDRIYEEFMSVLATLQH